jgi:putative inorganic carbon (hco3(-)) transporter
MRWYSLLLMILAGTVASYWTTTWAACLFLWHNIFRPQEFAYREGALPLPMYVLLVLVGSYFVNFLRGTLRPKWNGFLTLGTCYLVWMGLSAAMSQFGSIALDGWIEIIKYFAPLFLIGTIPKNIKEVKMIAFTLMISVGLWGAQGGVKGLSSGVTSSMAILGGQMTDNNDFMVAVVSTLPLFVYFGFNYDWKFKLPFRILMGLMFVLSVTAVVFSNSRGASVGLAGMLAIYCMIISRRRVRDTAIIIVLLAGVWQILPDTYFQRMETIQVGEEQTESSAAHRIEHAKAAWACTLDHPIFGVGPMCWLEIAPEYDRFLSEPHNVWLKCSVEVGFVGLFFFLGAIGMTLFGAMRVRRRATLLGDKDTASFATGMAMSVIGFIIPATFVSHPFSEMLWALFAVTNSLTTLYFLKKPQASAKKTRRISGMPRHEQLDLPDAA